jgi:hypothetical protein
VLKKVIALVAVMLCLSVSVLTLIGCAKKKAETKTEQAPADTTAAPAAADTAKAAK